ncbi:D-cysteine desulfhydrase [Streptomyces bingchenggensis BCW-1]|uniref:D-cysteine desulfhydrase n=2 Tax=Streptomyces TaxID=1883 RepID=D7CB79_STRBB|nr:D-cysteine desulfhydrase [Streptomyces bingchenggensis BCW-1]
MSRPTPLEPAPRLARAVGLEPGDLWVKRDDLIGLGGGGNKVDALTTAARTEGIVLDPVYTGRALAGLIAAVRDGQVRHGRRTVFLHTGGLPGLFGHAEALTRARSAVADTAVRWPRV